jgi:hypothetical protein
MAVTASGHHRVDLSWKGSPGANYYSVWRTTLHKDYIGGNYGLRTICLNDAFTDTHYSDITPTDGTSYSYYVQAANAAGVSAPSAAVTALPLPAAPSGTPGSLSGSWTRGHYGDAVLLNWTPVPGAVGYVIYRAGGTANSGDDSAFKWPDNFVTTCSETTYTDQGATEKRLHLSNHRRE